MVVLGMQEKELEFKMPTYSHVALGALLNRGFIKAIITSNHDNLHVKGGVRPSDMVDLFGNVYVEKCGRCGKLFHRNCITPTLGRICDTDKCGGKLMKTGTRMNSMTPEKPLQDATQYAKQADLALVLGSSMQVSPFCNLPPIAKQMVICNLQKTPYDSQAKIVIHQRCDRILREVMSHFGLVLDSFTYSVPFLIQAEPTTDSTLWKCKLSGIQPNEPCMCVEEVYIVSPGGKKHSLELTIDHSFMCDISTTIGSELTWVVTFKEQYQVGELRCTLIVDKMVQGKWCQLQKNLKF